MPPNNIKNLGVGVKDQLAVVSLYICNSLPSNLLSISKII